MLTVYNCLVNQHDLRLVGLAVLICALASFAAISLLNHAQRTQGSSRYVWAAIAAASGGFGIWATHFVAMLAFTPGIPHGYDVPLSALSLLAAIGLTFVGLSIALIRRLPDARLLGGAFVGLGIATMHYVGMAAFKVAGDIEWDVGLVAASILFGAVFAAAALATGLRRSDLRHTVLGAALLTVAIASMHFTAMGAAGLRPDPSISVPETTVPEGWLAVGVAASTFVILLLALVALGLDIRERRRIATEADRMRGLADAAVEGLFICNGDTVVTVNSSLAALCDGPADKLIGRPLDDFLPDAAGRTDHDERGATECSLRRANGDAIPVEVIRRPVEFAGKPHTAVAVRDLRDRKQAEERIHFLAHHDPLTGLPNRTAFNSRLDAEIREHSLNGRTLALLCLDLDRFKEVNDIFGHAAGDTMLQNVAHCVTSVLGDGQMMARLGGDEFAVICPDLHAPALAGELAETILEAMRGANKEAGSSALMSSSIGIATFPGDSSDRTSLLNHADTALYRAKADGRGIYRFFEAGMSAQVQERRLIERDLRHAIPRDEFSLVYQPLSQIETKEVVGFEALLRWHHPQRGLISPETFVPVAEETGLILQIGEWALRTACRQAAEWERPLSVAVNVSTVQLHSHGIAELVHTVLLQTGLKPERLELEITETALIRDLPRALAALRQLKALGVRIAMDDFGTGYSSLANLRAFPFDKLKIDRSFIKSVDRNEQSAAIVRAVLGLGRGLRLPVVAEGVEDIRELEFLAREACSQAQGYLLGRPAPIETFANVTRAAGTEVLPLRRVG